MEEMTVTTDCYDDETMTCKERLDLFVRLYEGASGELRSVDTRMNSTQQAFFALGTLCLPPIVRIVIEGVSPGAAVSASAWCALICCQITFFVIFFALMQVRLRNVIIAYLRYYAEQIDRLYCTLANDSGGLPLRQGERHRFYMKDADAWFGSYALAALPCLALFLLSIYFVFEAAPQIGPWWLFLAAELTGCVFYVGTWYKTRAECRYKGLMFEIDRFRKDSGSSGVCVG